MSTKVKHGQVELLGQLHQAQGLAIAFGRGMPKLRMARSLVSRPFWWPMTMQGVPLKRAEAADDGLVVARTCGRRAAHGSR